MIRPFFLEIKGVVWDFDGVIIPDSEQVNISALKKTFTDLGFSLAPEDIRSVIGKSSRKYVPTLLRKFHVGSDRDEEIIAINRKNYDELWFPWVKIAPGLESLLIHLTNAGIALAIATTNRRVVIDRFFDYLLRIENPSRVVVTGEDAKMHKPDPELYQLAASRLGIPPSNLLAVEDTEVGVRAAKAAKLYCAAIPNKFTLNQDFSQADCHLESLDELFALGALNEAEI